jgi:tRNA(Ile)-lysidine synthase
MSFEKIIENKNFLNLILNAIQEKYAIALSGGSDSLALFYIMKDFLYKKNLYNLPTLITVNHNFRQESKLECEFVQKIAKFYCFDFVCLNLEKTDFLNIKNKQDYARKMRYKLMIDYCKKNNIQTLMTAHHLDDQRETILMRLNRGAGVDSLHGIKKINIINEIKIIRPFLEIPKSLIMNYMSHNNHLWIEDRTNQSDNFERSRTRKQLSYGNYKISNDGINLLATKMKNAANALNFYTEIEYKNIVEINEKNEIKITKELFLNLQIEIVLRILKKIFVIHGEKKTNRVLYENLIDLYEKMKCLKNNHSLQFGNFLILSCDNCFLFKKLNSFK